MNAPDTISSPIIASIEVADEIAERILTLGYTPHHNFSDYQKLSTIQESKEVTDGNKCILNILESFKTVIELQRELLEITDQAGDEGLADREGDEAAVRRRALIVALIEDLIAAHDQQTEEAH